MKTEPPQSDWARPIDISEAWEIDWQVSKLEKIKGLEGKLVKGLISDNNH